MSKYFPTFFFPNTLEAPFFDQYPVFICDPISLNLWKNMILK